MNEFNWFIVLYLSSVLLASLSQILLKLAAQKKYPNKLREYLNVRVIVAYSIFMGTTLMTMLALRGVDLSTGMVLESAGYIFVALFSYVLLKERFSKRKLLGMALIVVGIAVYALAGMAIG